MCILVEVGSEVSRNCREFAVMSVEHDAVHVQIGNARPNQQLALPPPPHFGATSVALSRCNELMSQGSCRIDASQVS